MHAKIQSSRLTERGARAVFVQVSIAKGALNLVPNKFSIGGRCAMCSLNVNVEGGEGRGIQKRGQISS